MKFRNRQKIILLALLVIATNLLTLAFIAPKVYAVAPTAAWTLLNNLCIQWKDSGGTGRCGIYLDASNVLQLGGTGVTSTQLNNDLTLSTDNTYNIGTASVRLKQVKFGTNIAGFLSSGDTNPVVLLDASSATPLLKFGAGGGSTLDMGIGRAATGQLGFFNPISTEVSYIDAYGNLVFLGTTATSGSISGIGNDGSANGVLISNKASGGALSVSYAGTVKNAFSGSAFTKLFGIFTTGLGVPAVYASYNTAGLSALVSNAISYTPPAAAGVYRACVSVNVHTAAAVNMAVTLAYKDGGGNAQSYKMQLQEQGTTTVVNDMNNVAKIFTGCELFSTDNSATAITLSTTGTTMTSYDFSATLEQLA